MFQLLSTFNMETRDLVLGAKAIGNQSGLKTISAKHLMLASECLHCLIRLLPHVRRRLEQELPADKQKILASNFDALVSDCDQHRLKIYEKVQEIMKDRLNTHVTKWMQNNWDDDRVTVPSAATWTTLAAPFTYGAGVRLPT